MYIYVCICLYECTFNKHGKILYFWKLNSRGWSLTYFSTLIFPEPRAATSQSILAWPSCRGKTRWLTARWDGEYGRLPYSSHKKTFGCLCWEVIPESSKFNATMKQTNKQTKAVWMKFLEISSIFKSTQKGPNVPFSEKETLMPQRIWRIDASKTSMKTSWNIQADCF